MDGIVDLNFQLSTIIENSAKVLLILLITFIALFALRRIIPKAIRARIPRRRQESEAQVSARAETLSRVVMKAVSFIVWVVSAITILGAIGINIAPMLAAVGVAGLALGFAAQNIIRDYLHGFFIVTEDWYRVGEVADIAGKAGLVEDISLRRTILRDGNGTMHVIPNSSIQVASNMTRDWARINMNIGVGYGENLDRVMEVINDVCNKLKGDETWGPQLITTPSARRVDDLGDSGIEIKIMGDTQPMSRVPLMGELRKRIKARFDEEGIEIPWPHTKVYFGNSQADVETPKKRTSRRTSKKASAAD